MADLSVSEAIDRVNKVVDQLELVDRWGNPYLCWEVPALIGDYIGEAWDKNLERFCFQEISPSKYAENCERMIGSFATFVAQRKLENVLIKTRKGK